MGSNLQNFSSKDLGGWFGFGESGLGVAVGISGSVNLGGSLGFDENNEISTVSGKVGISFGLDYPTLLKVPVGGGGGKSTTPVKIIAF